MKIIRTIVFLGLVVTAVVLTGCGKVGPLVLPENTTTTHNSPKTKP